MILDTNAVSALLAGDQELAQVLDSEVRHHLPVIVIGEYRYGLARSRYRERLTELFDLLIRESVSLRIDEATAGIYATIRNELREKGRPIPENDLWIAAAARQHQLPIVSRDRHFDEISGIRRVEWLKN